MSKFWSKLSLFVTSQEPTIISLFTALCSFATPLKTSIYCVLALTFLDNITAVLLAIKRGETVESAKLRKTITKILIYLTAIAAAFICETSVLGQEKTLGLISKSIVFLVTSTELKSCLENLTAYSTLNGQSVNFWSVLLANLQAKGGTQFNITASQQSKAQDPPPNSSTTK